MNNYNLSIPLFTALLSVVVQLQAVAFQTDYPHRLSKSSQNITSAEKQSKITLVGTLGPIPVETFDCYGIKTLNGETYQLLGNFPKQDGALVQVRGKLLNNVRTACQVQGVVQVESIKVVRKKNSN